MVYKPHVDGTNVSIPAPIPARAQHREENGSYHDHVTLQASKVIFNKKGRHLFWYLLHSLVDSGWSKGGD